MARRFSFLTLLVVTIAAIGATSAVFFFYPNILTATFRWQPPVAKQGDTVILEGVSLRVVSVTRTPGTAPVTAPTGQEYVVAKIFLGNGTQGDLQVSPLIHFHLKDQQGHVYEVVPNPNLSPQLSGPLVRHDSLQEEISFLVPTGTKPLVLLYEPGQLGQSVARILLSS